MAIVYYEGQLLPEEKVRIPISDRGFQFGDGAYATIQVNEGIALFLEEQFSQLKSHCASMNLLLPSLKREVVQDLIEANGAHEGIWKLRIYATGGDREENYLPDRSGRVIMTLKPFQVGALKPLKLGLFSVPYASCHARFKSLAHLNRYYVMHEAHLLGLDDSVTTTEGGILLEAAFGNLFWVKEKELYICDPSLPLYFGMTLRLLIKMAQEIGFSIHPVCWKLQEIPENYSAFRTSSMHGISPIEKIETKKFMLNSLAESLLLGHYQMQIQEEKKRAAALSAALI